MQILRSLVLCLSLVFLAPYSHADLLVEPYIGYFSGDLESDSLTGPVYGARVGYQDPGGFIIGGEYMIGSRDWDGDDEEPSDLGVFVGYDFPLLLRVYGTYVFAARSKVDAAADYDAEGDGFKLGAGFTGLPFISINLEYFKQTYDELGGNAANSNLDLDGWALTVSLPLTF